MPKRGMSISNKPLFIFGVPLSVTVSGPPDKIIPFGFKDCIFSILTSEGKITENTPISLTLLAISCVY